MAGWSAISARKLIKCLTNHSTCTCLQELQHTDEKIIIKVDSKIIIIIILVGKYWLSQLGIRQDLYIYNKSGIEGFCFLKSANIVSELN